MNKLDKRVMFIAEVLVIDNEKLYMLEYADDVRRARGMFDEDCYYDLKNLQDMTIPLTLEAELLYSQELPSGRK